MRASRFDPVPPAPNIPAAAEKSETGREDPAPSSRPASFFSAKSGKPAGYRIVVDGGYSNDVCGYLGSRRVIEEGGYEGINANIRILNHPGRFAPSAEDTVVAKGHELVHQTRP